MFGENGSIPAVSRVTGLKEALQMVRNPAGVLFRHTERLGDTFIYPFGGVHRILVSSRPSVIRHVLRGRPIDFHKSEIQARHMREFLGPGLLTLEDQAWRQQRRLIQSAFHANRIAEMFDPMYAVVDRAFTRLDAVVAQGPIDAQGEMRRISFSMVVRSIIGAEVAPTDIAFVTRVIERVQDLIVRRIVRPYLAPWYFISGTIGRHQRLRRLGDQVILRHLVRRLKHRGREDFLAPLVDACPAGRPHDQARSLLPEVMQLLVAAHETSSTLLAWALYLLARDSRALAKLRAECAAKLPTVATAADYGELEYCTALLKEAMRLYPPFWMIDRLACAGGEADGVALPAGTRVALFIYGAHRSSQSWEAPGEFRPERFLGPEQENARTGAFLPFGTGPRTCVGSAYATLQMQMVLCSFVQRYDFVLESDHEIEPAAKLILRASEDISLRVRPRAASAGRE